MGEQARRWWPPIVGLPAAALLLVAVALAAVPADAFPAAARAELVSVQDQMESLLREGRALAERTYQAATGTQPSCPPPVVDSVLPAPTAELRPSSDGRFLGVQVANASCVAVTAHQRGPDLHWAWDDFTPTGRHVRILEMFTRKSQTLPVTVTAVGPGGTTVITGEQALKASQP